MGNRTEGAPFKEFSRPALYLLLFVLYLASTVPVGLLLYGLKSTAGWDIFAEGGFHTYMQCLQTSFPLSESRTSHNGLNRIELPGRAD